MKDDDFINASIYIRVLEKRTLNNTGISRILETSGISEAMRQISQNSGYDFSTLKKVEDYEEVLKAGLKESYDLLYSMSPSKAVIDIPAAKYTFHNLKVVFKSKYTGVNMSRLYSDITETDMSDVENFIFNKETGKEQDLPEYIKLAAQDVKNKFEDIKDPQIIDIASDKHMFDRMLSLCKDIKSDFITEYVRISIDFYNIKTLIRVKNMNKGSRFLNESLVSGGLTDTKFFLEHYDKSPDMLAAAFYYKYFGNIMKQGMESYGRTGNYSELERLLDNYLTEYLKKAKYIAFGAEVLFAYIMSKENEIRQIRILIAAKYNDIQAEDLKERIRDNNA